MIESRIVDHQWCITDEGKKLIRNIDKSLLFLQKFSRQAMHCKSLRRYIALGIYVRVERRSRRDAVQ